MKRISRKTALSSLLAFGAAVTGLTARAFAKGSKAQFRYQDHPNGNQRCAGCAFFVSNGTCKIVEGSISADGWCSAFSER